MMSRRDVAAEVEVGGASVAVADIMDEYLSLS
jgi:hypothetical protein